MESQTASGTLGMETFLSISSHRVSGAAELPGCCYHVVAEEDVGSREDVPVTDDAAPSVDLQLISPTFTSTTLYQNIEWKPFRTPISSTNNPRKEMVTGNMEINVSSQICL